MKGKISPAAARGQPYSGQQTANRRLRNAVVNRLQGLQWGKVTLREEVSSEVYGGQGTEKVPQVTKYTMQTLPEPWNPAVILREFPARKMAAVRYRGTWSQKRYEKHRARLEEFVAGQGWTVQGEPVFARYDPPFQLPFLRRNEVLIPVE